MKYIENNLKQASVLSDMVPPLKPLKKKTKKGDEDDKPKKDVSAEDVAAAVLLKIDKLTKFDIKDYVPEGDG